MEDLPTPPQKAEVILESITDAFAAVDKEWRFVYVNRSYIELVSPLYESAEALLGAVMWDKLPDIAEKPVGEFYRRAMESQQPGEMELFYEPLQVWIEVRAHPSPSLLSLYIRDVTERKLQERTLLEMSHTIAEQAGIFDAILSNIPDLAYAFDFDQRLIYANHALLRLWGLEMNQARGLNLYELNYPPELADRLTHEMRRVIETGENVTGEVFYLGDFHDYVYSPAFSENGEVSALVGTTRLVSERKRAEISAEKHLKTLRLVVENAPLPTIMTELALSLEAQMPGGAVAIHSFEADRSELRLIAAPSMDAAAAESLRTLEVPGKILVSQAFHHRKLLVSNDLLLDERRQECREIAQILDAQACWSLPVTSSSGTTSGSITVFFREKTTDNKLFRALETAASTAALAFDRKRTEAELIRARDEALAGSRAKDQFLATLSHELRSPLNPVLLTASEYALDSTLPEELREAFSNIADHVALEARLIDDLLDLTSIVHGKMRLNLRPLRLDQLIANAIAIVEGDFDSKGVRLMADEVEPSIQILGDPTRLQQVFWNVLKNAVKFTSADGTVRLRSSSGEQEGQHLVEIADSGVGMTSDELQNAFDAFAQGEHSRGADSSGLGGLGLGLAIASRIVSSHGGRMEAFSEGRGRGCSIRISLPLAPREEPAAAAPSAGDAEPVARLPVPMRILLVEDHEPTRTVLSRLLQARGHEVFPAGSVAEGREVAASQTIDIVVSDIGLPDGTGYELMSGLRETYGLSGIALTGYGMDDDVRESHSSGFVAHVTKPVDVRTLEKALLKAAR